MNYYEQVEAFQRKLIEDAMRHTGNNCLQAAKLLGLQRSTLVMIRKKFGMTMSLKQICPHCRKDLKLHSEDSTE